MESVSTLSSEFFTGFKNSNVDKQMFLNRFNILLNKQGNDRVINPNFAAFQQRKKIVTKFLMLSKIFDLKQISFASSTCLLDLIISKHNLSDKMMESVGKVVLSLSIKVHESEYVPQSSIWSFWGEDRIKKEQLEKLEKMILNEIDFKINRVTPFDFLEMFLMIKDVHTFSSNSASKTSKKYKNFINLVWTVYQIISMDYQINKYSSHCIATVVIMIARQRMGASVLIPDQMASLVRADPRQLNSVFAKFLESTVPYLDMF